MEHTIQHAAQVVDGILGADPQIAHEMRGDEPDRIARALAEAGLLDPAPRADCADAWNEGQDALLRDLNHKGKRMRVTPNPYEERAEGDGRGEG